MAVKGKKCRDIKSMDWVSSSFGDSFGLSLNENDKDGGSDIKRLKTEGKHEFNDFNVCEDDLLLIENELKLNGGDIKKPKLFSVWCEKYKPKNVDDLVINKKKILEVESWLKGVFLGDNLKNKSKILLLTGPTGCGKTCTLNVLCDNLNINIIEWVTPMNMLLEFNENRYDNNFFACQSSVTQLFDEFIVRSSKYTSLLSLNDVGDNKKIVLVKDFPNIFLDKPNLFHQTLEKYFNNNSNNYQISPIVFVLSCQDIIRELFSDDIKSQFNITNINFNPVTETNMVKALNKILTIESKKSSSKSKIPCKDDLIRISDSSDGDLRSAILKLQFSLDNSGKIFSDNSFKVPKSDDRERIKVKKLSSSKRKVCEIDKDKKLDFFNYIGRVLYPKKEIIDSKIDKTSKNYKFVHSPEAIVDSYLVEPNKFVNMLHENYLDRFTNIKDVSVAALSLSMSDFLLSSWESKDVMVPYSLSTVVRTLMTSNSAPAQNSWKPLSKSKVWVTENNRKENLKAVRCIFPSTQSEKDVLLDVIPLLKRLNFNLTPDQDRIVSKISHYKH